MIIKMTPHRRAVDNLVTSHGLPDIKIRVADTLRYMGELKFTLMDAARVEMFLFAEDDVNYQFKRIFVVQFEGYLPDNDFRYEYPALEQVQLGQHGYMTDGGVLMLDRVMKRRPEGDIAVWVNWLKQQGYDPRLWNDMGYRRFVRLVDKSQRNEILLLYFENLYTQEERAEELLRAGESDPRLLELKAQVHANALRSFLIEQG